VKNERILITGGAGFLGREIISRTYKDNEITVFSRDEAKHYYLKRHYPRVRFVVGDVRDFDRLKRACGGHTTAIFAASLKQIEACDENPQEASRTIIDGAFNSRKAAEDCGLKSACFISSDKSRAATTVYGAMKYVAGESFILHPQESPARLTTAIYGNVLNSTGSVIPLIWSAIKNRQSLNLYSTEMTRFLLTVEEAVSLVLTSLESQITGVNIVPKTSSARISDLFEIYAELFGLKYEVYQPRVGEKIHEVMASEEETRRMRFSKELGFYIMDPKKEFRELSFPNSVYSSRDVCISKEELNELLRCHDHYRV
jgi:UDP-glucose 4-epimerase